MAYHVTAAQAVAHLKGGKQVYLDHSALVPDNIEAEHLKHLIAVGVVADDASILAEAKADAKTDAAKAKADAS